MANTASRAPTTQPATAPAIRPRKTDPEALATMAATNAPSSSWPSMPMLTTPDREQITPVSAPSMIGIDWLSVPCSRFTMLNGLLWPASAQHSRDTMKATTTTPMLTRRHRVGIGTNARTPASTSDAAPQPRQVTSAGSCRFGTETLANGWEKAKLASPLCANRPNTRMSTRPKMANPTGASQRRQGLTGAASATTTGDRSVIVMVPCLPLASCQAPSGQALDARGPGAAQPVYRSDQRRCRHEHHDQRLQYLDDVHRGGGLGLHQRRARVQRAEQQRRQHHAERAAPAQQRDRDGVDAVGPVALEVDAVVGALDDRRPGQPGQAPGDQHDHHPGTFDVHAGYPRGVRVLADRAEQREQEARVDPQRPAEQPPQVGVTGDERADQVAPAGPLHDVAEQVG